MTLNGKISAKIFLAEDDEDDRLLFHEALNEINSRIPLIESHDGVHLMKNLKEHEIEKGDILFLDLNMPLMNGFECMDQIKDNNKLNRVKVVVFSTTAEEDYVEKSFQKGAFMYVKKPDSFQMLINTIKKVLDSNMDNRPARHNFLFQLT